MYCKYCGSKVDDNARFCPQCGKALAEHGAGRERLKLRCAECGAEMTVNQDGSILRCPYCGTSEIILESDSVTIAKIQADAEKAKMALDAKVKEKAQILSVIHRLLEAGGKRPFFTIGLLLCIIAWYSSAIGLWLLGWILMIAQIFSSRRKKGK